MWWVILGESRFKSNQNKYYLVKFRFESRLQMAFFEDFWQSWLKLS